MHGGGLMETPVKNHVACSYWNISKAIVGVPEKWIVEFGSRLMKLRYEFAILHY